MAFNHVRERWREGLPAISGWMTSACPLVAETLAAAGFDAVIIDMQHSATTLEDAVRLAAVIELRGAEPFVRIPSLDHALMGKLVDLGITGIIVPMVESRNMADALVSAVRYPPLGSRSVGPRRPKWRFGEDYCSNASETIVTLAMIETSRGFDALEEIATTSGLDGIFVGPADLKISLAGGAAASASDSDIEDAIAAIRTRTWSAGCRAGIFGASTDTAARRLREGFDFVSATPDLVCVAEGATRDLELLRCPTYPEDQVGAARH